MPKARHDSDILGNGRKLDPFTFESEDISFTWDPAVSKHGGLRTTTAGGAKVVLEPGVATRPSWLGKTHRHSWHVTVNGVELYHDVWSDEQLPEPVLRSIVKAAIASTPGLLLRFAPGEVTVDARGGAPVGREG